MCEQRGGSKVVHIHCGTQSCCTYRGRRALDKKQKKTEALHFPVLVPDNFMTIVRKCDSGRDD